MESVTKIASEQQPSQEEIELAIKQHLKKIKDSPNNPWAYSSLGDYLVTLNQLKKAKVLYYKALKLKPKFHGFYSKLGKLYQKIQNFDKSNVCYATSIKLNPSNYWAYENLCQNLIAQDKIDRAIAYYQQTLSLEPENARIYRKLGQLYTQQKKFSEAIVCYQKAISLNPESSQCYNRLAKSMMKIENIEEAIVNYKKSIEHNKKGFDSYLQLSKIFAQKKDLDAAIDYYSEALKINKQSIEANLGLGDCLTKQERFKKAIPHYRTATYQKTIKFYPHLKDTYHDPSSIAKPDFLIIGTPKGGTTSLYHYLIEHPQVIPCLKKEIHFWPWRYYRGLDWYLSHFPRIPEGKYMVGEATTDYFDRDDVAHEVYDSFPQVKAIAILRNPIDRAISQYHHWVRLGWENRTLEEAINADIQLIKQNPEIPITKKVSWKNYLPRGIYIELLQEWLKVFPSKQLLILKSEDFYAEPQKIFNLVLDYLGLPSYELSNYKKYNGGSYPKLKREKYQELQDLFEPYNQQLYQEIGINFND